MKPIINCPSCGGNRIKTVRRNWQGEYQGHKYTVKNLEFQECPDCGEKVYDRQAMLTIEAQSPAFAKTSASSE